MEHEELTPTEREMLDRLPRTREASRLLEERTVRALRDRGLLSDSVAPAAVHRTWKVLAGVAASVALFVSGLAVGQAMGARHTADALSRLYPDPAERAAALVQSTGSAHVTALGRLVEASEAADPQELRRAREVALSAFWAAAAEIVRLAPDDPVAARILTEIESSREAEEPVDGAVRRMVWF